VKRRCRRRAALMLPAWMALVLSCTAGPVGGTTAVAPPVETPAPASPTPGPAGAGSEPGNVPLCTDPGAQEVSSADQLQVALAGARPGTAIHLADGVYPGAFEISVAGTAEQPISLCGSRDAVLDGGSPDAGTTLHLQSAAHWRLNGFTVQGGKKGLMVDGSTGVVVDGLLIHRIGDEALHLRAASTDNVVRNTTIRDTGLREPEFGEGIYVGSATSNWCRYSGCGPDRSDRNTVESNDIAATTAESVDIKEGTSGGVLRGNRFSGIGMSESDSWVDVKGSDWSITDNIGSRAPEDGFQVHVIGEGSGERNAFERNVADVGGDGYGINVTKRDRGNVVGCSNRSVGAAAGLSTIPCT
jgi:hypothetical protein